MSADPERAAQLREVERLISQLDNKVRSAKVRAATSLQSISIYPDIISEHGVFLQKVMTPVLMRLSDEAEKMRELSVALITAYSRILPKSGLLDTLTYVLPPVLARLKETGETAEHVRYALMELLLVLIELCGPDSHPASWDQFVQVMEPMMKVAFKASDAEMKKVACVVMDAATERSTAPAFRPIGADLVKAILPNCAHRHHEVRRMSVLTLGRVLVKSENNDDIDKVHDVVQKLVFDKNAGVRRALIEFTRMMLVDHPMRHVMYHPLMLSLMFFVAPIVPLRPIYCGVPAKVIAAKAEEAELAYGVAMDIGRQHEEDKYEDMRKELQYFEEEQFDENKTIPRGLTHIVQDLFPKWMDKLLPKLSDWTEATRKFAYMTMRSVLHCALSYSTRYIPQITHAVAISLRDFPKEADDSLQVAAVMASNVPACDVIMVLLPQLTNDGPPHMLLLLAATTLNDNPNDGELGTILDGLRDGGVYDALVAVDSLVQLLLSMIKRSTDFAEVNAVNLLNMIIRICEHSDAMKLFEDAFGRPLSLVIAENLQMLLMGSEVTPLFLTTLLNAAPDEATTGCQQWVCQATAKTFKNGPKEVSTLVEGLARRKCLQYLNEDYISRIIGVGKESTSMLRALIETNSLHESLLNEKSVFLDAILSAMKAVDDDERLVAVDAMRIFESKARIPATHFDKVYAGLIEAMKDHMNAIRVESASIMSSYLPKCVDISAVPSKFAEIVVSIDDEGADIRQAISDLCRSISAVTPWRDSLVTTVKAQTNYHSEATELCELLLSEWQ